MIESALKIIQGLVRIRGGTDGTLIGNSGDRLKVAALPEVNFLATNTYCTLFIGNAASSGVDNPLLLFRNPAGSGKTCHFRRLALSGSAINNVSMQFKVFSNPTVTSFGTSLNVADRAIGVSQPTSIVLANQLPTLSSLGTLIATAVTGQNTSSLNIMDDYLLSVGPGQSIIVTGDPSSNNRQANITIVWKEL